MDGGIDLHAGDGTVIVFRAEHQTKGAAPGAQIQDLRVFRKPYKMGQHCRIGAEGEGFRGDMEGQSSG